MVRQLSTACAVLTSILHLTLAPVVAAVTLTIPSGLGVAVSAVVVADATGPTALPCVVTARTPSNVTCSLLVPFESMFVGGAGGSAALTLFNGTALPPVPVPATVPRTLVAVAGTGFVVPSSGGVISASLSVPVPLATPEDLAGAVLPPAATCNGTASSLRCWVGTLPCSDCAFISGNSSLITCTAPGSTAVAARLVVEVCGIGNATGDGSHPTAPLPVTPALPSGVISFVPNSAFQQAGSLPADRRGVSHNQPSNVSLAVSAADVAGLQALIGQVSLNGTACGGLAWNASAGSVTCVLWRPAQPVDAMSPTTQGQFGVSLSVLLRGVHAPLAAVPALAALPRLAAVVPAATVMGGCVTVFGEWLLAGFKPGEVVVRLGSGPGALTLTNVSLASQSSLRVCLPAVVPQSTPGFPVMALSVVNGVGASDDGLTLAVTPQESTALASPLGEVVMLPAPRLGNAWQQLAALTATGSTAGSGPAVCSLAVTDMACPARAQAFGGVLPSPDAQETGTAGPAAVSVPFPNTVPGALFTIGPVGVYGRLGCAVNASVSCVDALARRSVAASAISVRLLDFSAAWAEGTPSTITALPLGLLPNVTIRLLPSSVAPAVGYAAQVWACTTVLVPAAAAVALDWSAPLQSSAGSALLATGACAVANGSASAPVIANCSTLTVPASAQLGARFAVYAECTFTPSGERIRLAPLTVWTLTAAIALAPSGGVLPVQAYAATALQARMLLSWPAVLAANASSTDFTTAGGTCRWSMASASSAQVVLSQATTAAALSVAADGSLSPAPAVVVQGQPGGNGSIALLCTVWGQAVSSPSLPFLIAPYIVAYADAAPRFTLPSSLGTSGAVSELWPSPLSAVADAQASLTCTPAIAASSCPPAGFVLAGRSFSPAAVAAQIAGARSVATSGVPTPIASVLPLVGVGVFAAGGCIVSLSAACRDGANRANATQLATVTVASFSATWAAGVGPAIAVIPPGPLPNVVAMELGIVGVPSNFAPPLQSGAWSCACALTLAHVALATNATLIAQGRSALSIVEVDSSLGAGSLSRAWVAAFPVLDGGGLGLGSAASVTAECTWAATGERVRSASLPLVVPAVLVAVHPASVPGFVVSGATASVSFNVTAVPAPPAPMPTLLCGLRLVASTARSVSVSGTDATVPAWGAAANVSFNLQGPSGAVMTLVAECNVWNRVAASAPFNITLGALAIEVVQRPASPVVFSGVGQLWPLAPALVVGVLNGNGQRVDGITCTALPSSRGISIVTSSIDTDVQIAEGVASGRDDNLVHFPVWGLTGTYDTSGTGNSTAVVRVECVRDTGEAVQSRLVSFPVLTFAVAVCQPPQATTTSQQRMPPFSARLVHGAVLNATALHALGASIPCAAHGTALPATVQSLPPLVCSVAGTPENATAADGSDIVFLQGEQVTLAAPATGLVTANWTAFSVTSSPNARISLRMSCTLGGVALQPTHAFPIQVTGCPIGREAVGIFCSTCASGNFSMGTDGAAIAPQYGACQACPSAGAACVDGVISLLPNFFRPQRHVALQLPLGPATELHPCFNGEACRVFNATDNATHTCSPGYTGALCGVCDDAAGFARFGSVCRMCWSRVYTDLFAAAVVLAVAGLMMMYALRPVTAARSPAAIVLKITLSFLQAVGSLKAFRAGGTRAYREIFGWTDTVSESPLAVGALTCLWHPPYLAQYLATVALPLLAAGGLIVIYMAALAVGALHCSHSGVSLDVSGLRNALAVWWRERRYISTLTFVLFLAYMSIISSSLRALDCVGPIDGARYLRTDLRVTCGVGEHLVAMVVAIVVLVGVGLGFPLLLIYRLATATPDLIVQPAFRSAWGFLYDGYRTSSRETQRIAAAAAEIIAAHGSHISAAPEAGSIDASASTAASVRSKLAEHARASQLVLVAADAYRRTRGMSNEGGAGERNVAHRRVDTAQPCHDRLLHRCCTLRFERLLWWEGLVLLHKAGIVVLAVAVTDPFVQCAGATLLMTIALVLHVHFKPYADRLFNLLERASLAASAATASISSILLQYRVTSAEYLSASAGDMTVTQWAVTIVLSLINLGTLTLLVAVLAYLISLEARRRAIILRAAARGLKGRAQAYAAGAGSVLSAYRSGASPNDAPDGVATPRPNVPAGDDHDGAFATANPMLTVRRLGSEAAAGWGGKGGSAANRLSGKLGDGSFSTMRRLPAAVVVASSSRRIALPPLATHAEGGRANSDADGGDVGAEAPAVAVLNGAFGAPRTVNRHGAGGGSVGK